MVRQAQVTHLADTNSAPLCPMISPSHIFNSSVYHSSGRALVMMVLEHCSCPMTHLPCADSQALLHIVEDASGYSR